MFVDGLTHLHDNTHTDLSRVQDTKKAICFSLDRCVCVCVCVCVCRVCVCCAHLGGSMLCAYIYVCMAQTTGNNL